MLEMQLPNEFKQILLFQYLRRSANEITFETTGDRIVTKLFDLGKDLILAEIRFENGKIRIRFPDKQATESQEVYIKKYIADWFDLETNLGAFYTLAKKDPILKSITTDLKGLRMVKAPDLFEAICWSIIGQQINLPFAYSCKRALVERAGKQLHFKNKIYYSFPRPENVLEITDLEFRDMKFSGQKVKYIRGVANEIIKGNLSKNQLEKLSFEETKARLVKLNGIGNWSANYVLMRCLSFKEAFPIEDVGLHNTLKIILKRDTKPSLEEIRMLAKNWKGWEAYATFYLWQTLL